MKILKSHKTLEFDKILEKLKDMCESELGRDLVNEEKILTDLRAIKKAQEETSEGLNLISKRGNPPLFGITNIHDFMRRVELGGSLSPQNLLRVSDFLRVSRILKKYIFTDDDDLSINNISNLAENLYVNKNIEEIINNAIISENEISDNASSKLASIRRTMANKKVAIRDRLSSIVSGNEDSKYLQDNIITMREGRYVVPVKTENKGKIKGLVHDLSSSGATVYIEPIAVVNLNNELKELESKEREEIEKILKELSEKVAEYSHEIAANQYILKELDFIFAKAKLSIEMNGIEPVFNEDKIVDLIGARHPLLNKNKIVPIDISIGENWTSLIITGPNTGGKTVTLKTLGLLSLMGQFGMHIPAKGNSKLSIFHRIFADIGDEQSIEQSLSTFSAHMVNIVDILKNADEDSLVLFDELGAGTDPTEGAALARAIMDHMLEKKIRCVSTTHYNQLKIYALTSPGVQNASMEFNVETLSPTFKLIIGIPGKSNAFEISKRLGLSEEIINLAKTFVSNDNIEFEKVLQSIEEDRSQLEKNKSQIEIYKEEIEKQNKRLDQELLKIQKEKEKILKDAKLEASRILRRAKEDSDLALSQIKDVVSEVKKDQARRLQESQDIIRDNIKAASINSEKIEIKHAEKPITKVIIGDSVRVNSLNAEGIILELPDQNGNVLVQVGMLKMKVPKNSLISIEDKKDLSNKTKNIIKRKSSTIKTEIDIRGNNFHEAKPLVDKYLDDAYLSGLKSVRIIHGKGTGALREKLRDYLKKNKYIKDICDAPYNEGGMGASIITFK